MQVTQSRPFVIKRQFSRAMEKGMLASITNALNSCVYKRRCSTIGVEINNIYPLFLLSVAIHERTNSLKSKPMSNTTQNSIVNANSPRIALVHSYLAGVEIQCSSRSGTGLLKRPQAIQFDISSHRGRGCIRQIVGYNKSTINQFGELLL